MHVLNRPAPPADARIAYGAGPSEFGDLRLPVGAGPHPVVIVIHGGFWRAKYNLDHIGHLAAALTREGVATWTIEYRRVGEPGGGWPGTFLDVAAAADCVRALARDFPLNPGRIIALGHSAGGHLALWLAARHRIPSTSVLHREQTIQLVGAISLAGAAELRAVSSLHLSDDAVHDLMGGSPDVVPERYGVGSPAELLPCGVRLVLIHGEADADVPARLSRDYARLASESGDVVEVTSLPGADHFVLVDPDSAAWPVVLSAIRRTLDLDRAATPTANDNG
jgi:acetyl esterase/lipase